MTRSLKERKAEALGEIAVAYGALRFAEQIAEDTPLGLMASAAADAMAIAIPAELLSDIAGHMFVASADHVKQAEANIRRVVIERDT